MQPVRASLSLARGLQLTSRQGRRARFRPSRGADDGGVRRDERDGGADPAGLSGACRLAQPDSRRNPAAAPARGRTPVPPHRHHLRGLWRSRLHRAADPVRRDPARARGERMGHGAARARAAHQGDQPLHQGHLFQARGAARRHRAGRSRIPEPGVPARDERPARAARHLRVHRRHRHRARRCRHLLCAGRQCPHALRRLLHAGEPRDHAAAVPRPVRAPSRRAGRELSGRAARDAEVGRAGHRRRRADRRAAHPRDLQLGLLRALVPRRQARHRAGRGARPHRQGRDRLHAHDARPEARRRDLPPHRRRLPRSARRSARIRRSACPA